MRLWRTELQAVDNKDGKVKQWAGPCIPGIDWEDAQDYIRNNEMTYLTLLPEVELSRIATEDFLDQLFIIPVN